MNWDAVAAVAELLGAVGVIGSLVYVATQVRHATRATKLDTAVRVMETSLALTDPLTRSRGFSHLAIATLKGQAGRVGGRRSPRPFLDVRVPPAYWRHRRGVFRKSF